MKFLTLFLALFATTAYAKESKNDLKLKSNIGVKSIFGGSFNVSNKLILNKRHGLVEMVSPECQKDLKGSKEYICLASEFTSEEWEKNCPIILSDVCDKFYAEPTKYFPNCKNDEIIQVFLTSKEVMVYLKSNTGFFCSTDESGKICPAAEVSRNGGRWNERAILESCESKKCTDVFSDMLIMYLNNLDVLVEKGVFKTIGDVKGKFSEINEKLKSETCTSKHVNVSSNGSSASSGDSSASSNDSSITSGGSNASSGNSGANSDDLGANSGDVNVISKINSTLLVVITLILAYF